MTPGTEISAISKDDSLEKILHTLIRDILNFQFMKNSLDNILGIVYLYDLSLRKITRRKPIHFTPYSKRLMELMTEFQNSHHALAIVLDEHGGTAGLITVEDVFEELFGDFEDEFDTDSVEGIKNKDGSFSINAKMDWEIFNDQFQNIIPQGDYETIGGFIISQIGRIPNQGEHLFTSIGQIEIIKATARRIIQVKIYPS